MRKVDVYANPYSALDADGVPQGVVEMPGTRNAIGAFIDHVATAKTGKVRYYFTGEKVTVPWSAEIARAINEGGIIVATEEHARMAGIANYVEPLKQLENEKAKALALRKAQLGESAQVAAVPTEALPLDQMPTRQRSLAPNISFRTEEH